MPQTIVIIIAKTKSVGKNTIPKWLSPGKLAWIAGSYPV
jgi:hypothetical protein